MTHEEIFRSVARRELSVEEGAELLAAAKERENANYRVAALLFLVVDVVGLAILTAIALWHG